MNVQSEFEEFDNYLFVKVRGRWELDEIKALADSVRRHADQKGQTRILVDMLEVKGRAPEMDRFRIGEHVAALFPGQFKLAVSYRGEWINKFAENVAVNRGARMLIVDNTDAALQWLLAKEDKGKP